MKYQIKKTYSGRKKTQGLALLEILIAIGILGLIAAGVATLASRTFEERNANEITSNITDMALSIQKAYQRAGTYTATTTNTVSELVDGNVVPKAVGTNPVTNGFYSYSPAYRISNATLDGFTIGIDGLSQSLCTTVLNGLLPEARYVEVVLGGQTSVDNGVKQLSAAANWGGAAANGVVKTTVGYVSDIDDPTKTALICGNSSNKIIAGYF